MLSKVICMAALLAAASLCRASDKDVIILAMRGENGSDVLKLDGETLRALACYEKEFWGPIASLLALPDGNFIVIEQTSRRADPSQRSKMGVQSGRASIGLVRADDFRGFNYGDIEATSFYGSDAPDAIDGSLGGIVNRFGEVLLNQNCSGNFDGGQLFDGLDPELNALDGESGLARTGALDPPVCGAVGAALSNGDWALVGYQPLGPDQGMASMELRPRKNIRDRSTSIKIFRTGVKEDPPTSVTTNRNDKIALGTESGTIRQISFTGPEFVVDATVNPGKGPVTAVAALSNGDWAVCTNGPGEKPGAVWVLKEGGLETLRSLSGLPKVSALAVQNDDDIVIGTETGEILLYDSQLKHVKRSADGFNPITRIAVLTAAVTAGNPKSRNEEPEGVETHTEWVNALKPNGEPGVVDEVPGRWTSGPAGVVLVLPKFPLSRLAGGVSQGICRASRPRWFLF